MTLFPFPKELFFIILQEEHISLKPSKYYLFVKTLFTHSISEIHPLSKVRLYLFNHTYYIQTIKIKIIFFK